MSGARQSAVVRLLVTRVPPMRREKAAVNGAMKRICAWLALELALGLGLGLGLG